MGRHEVTGTVHIVGGDKLCARYIETSVEYAPHAVLGLTLNAYRQDLRFLGNQVVQNIKAISADSLRLDGITSIRCLTRKIQRCQWAPHKKGLINTLIYCTKKHITNKQLYSPSKKLIFPLYFLFSLP